LAAALPASAGPWVNKLSFQAALVANSTLGGIASVAGGDKFANGAVTGAFGYLFNASLGKINESFDAAGGHHVVPRSEALSRGDLLSDDAAEYFGRTSIGEGFLNDMKDRDNPHKFNAAHRAYNAAVGDELDDYIAKNNISPANKMTRAQAVEFEEQVRYSER